MNISNELSLTWFHIWHVPNKNKNKILFQHKSLRMHLVLMMEMTPQSHITNVCIFTVRPMMRESWMILPPRNQSLNFTSKSYWWKRPANLQVLSLTFNGSVHNWCQPWRHHPKVDEEGGAALRIYPSLIDI